MTAALTLSGVCKRYPAFALEDVDLALPEGEIMGLVGVNGAGKSTLLRLLGGLALPDRGTIEVLGHPMPAQQVQAKREIGLASEDMRLYGSQTLRWHMDLVRAAYPRWDEAYAGELLRRFDLRAAQPLKAFSHGQRVKALLLLNLARRPRLLLLDEPTTGLVPVARAEVLEALSEVLRDAARSVLFSSHDTHDIERLADRITFLHGGRVIDARDTAAFLDDWRRIVCHGALPASVGQWDGVASVRANGSLSELRVRGAEAVVGLLRAAGADVRSVDPMNLEEIFVATVRGGGKH
jgi:ABC-2 type transport system ATP-binding protein